MNQRIRVLLLIPHLGGGGAEKVAALLASGLPSDRYEVHLGLVTERSVPADAPRGIQIHTLAARRVRFAAVPLLALVRRLKPQVVLSGMYHLNFLVLLLRPFFPRSTHVLVRQNGPVSVVMSFEKLPIYNRLLYRRLYRRADCVICQSYAMAHDLAEGLGIPVDRLAVLSNPVDAEAVLNSIDASRVLWTGPGPHLLAVGRLARQKGYELLLPALAAVRERYPCADLVIAGTGPEEAALKAQCRSLNLDSAVTFTGYIGQPTVYFPGATAFVLSSWHEGMPNAMLEAAAAGLPIVALPAAGGFAPLLRDQPGAWLAPEISEASLISILFEALAALRPAERFEHAFLRPFLLENAVRGYQNLIDFHAGNAPASQSELAETTQGSAF
jgi:glycosyltransferase involved in cell wall biosynthesis